MADVNDSLVGFIKAGNTSQVRDLLAQGVNVNGADDWGETALICAAQKSQFEILKMLIEAGANVNASTSGGFSALTYSARNGDLDSVKFLLEKGADPNIVTNKGATPLSLAHLFGKDADPVDRPRYSEIILLLTAASEAAELRAKQQRAEAERKRQEEDKRKREQEEARRREEEARRKAENERRSGVQATRRSSGQCIMCGQSLSFVQKLFRNEKHGGCQLFKE